jgi:antitoxin YefM
METISLVDAKARLSAVLDDVESTHERYTITRNGKPVAVIIAVDDMEGLMETLDILSTPGALEEIRAAEAEPAEVVDPDELRAQIAARQKAAA